MNKIITSGNQHSNIIRDIEGIIKLLYAMKPASEPLDMYRGRIDVSFSYDEFLKHKIIVYAVIGKPNSIHRNSIVKRMQKDKETINSNNKLIKTIQFKTKQFQEDEYIDFLKEQTRNLRQGKDFEINKCQEIIKKSGSNQIINKFQDLMDAIKEKDCTLSHEKLSLNLRLNSQLKKSLFPSQHKFTMKIIGKRGSGKTTFSIHFLELLIKKGIVSYDDVWIFCPTYSEQKIWQSLSIPPRDDGNLRLDESVRDKPLVFDDLQNDLKKSKVVGDIFTKGRHHTLGIIQCEQFTQRNCTY